MKPTVLIVDDDRSFRFLAETALNGEGFEAHSVGSLAKARSELNTWDPDILILDRRLPDGDGIELLREMRSSTAPGPLVVVVTAYGDVDNAVAALQAGAVDYLTKPVQVTDLLIKLRKVLEARGLRDRLQLARSADKRPRDLQPKSAAMRRVRAELEQVSSSPLTPVFLVGPSGAGKQHAAELLHRMSHVGSEEAPFVDVNCAALPLNLVESELFGHERGAFTDAKSTRRGLIELADSGTLFLDEIADLPEGSQAKLLKFLDSLRFRRLGGQREIEVELRIIAATSRDPQDLLASGRLREDLYHRLAVFTIRIPPLRERREDILPLAQAFIDYFSARVKKQITGLSEGAIAALGSYEFPGNVRELRNIVERAIILSRGPLLTEQDLVLRETMAEIDTAPRFFSVGVLSDGKPPPLDSVERAYVARVLDHTGGRRMLAAEVLGISYPTFLKRLREFGLEGQSRD